MIELAQKVWPTVTQDYLIVATFATFVAFILIFAVVHYWLYRRVPARFWVTSEIALKQAEETIARLQREIAVLTTESDALAEVLKAVEEGEIRSLPAILPSGRRVNGGAYQGRLPNGNADDGAWLSVTTEDGSLLCRLDEFEYFELTPSSLAAWLSEALARRKQRRDERHRRINELERQPSTSLRFWDFVYFSGVSQTTVGYGDILPNATSIRILVLAQILLGYALLIVFLNLVLAG